jgi:hypothetical protein
MKKPHLPHDLSELPPPPSKDIVAFLPVLGTRPLYPPEWCFDDECYQDEPADAPIRPPGNRGYITMVEWPIRPGHTRIEAYFIGMNRTRSCWLLWQFVVDDDAFTPKLTYLEKHVIVRMKRQKLSKRDSAILMLKYAWEYKRDNRRRPSFMLVSDTGLISSAATYGIADTVWGSDNN